MPQIPHYSKSCYNGCPLVWRGIEDTVCHHPSFTLEGKLLNNEIRWPKKRPDWCPIINYTDEQIYESINERRNMQKELNERGMKEYDKNKILSQLTFEERKKKSGKKKIKRIIKKCKCKK